MKTRWAGIAASVVLLVVPMIALAGPLDTHIVPSSCNDPGGCHSICDIVVVAQNVLNAGIYILIFLSAVFFAWAGWLALTAGGSQQQWTKAKSIFGNVVIAIIIITVGYIVISVLMQTLTGTSAWTSICNAR